MERSVLDFGSEAKVEIYVNKNKMDVSKFIFCKQFGLDVYEGSQE